jgi:hypothetical protein
MPQRLDSQGELVFTADEVGIARAALYLARYHRDQSVAGDEFVETLTGVELSDMARLMDQIDDLTGHSQEARRIIEDRLQYLGSLSDGDLGRQVHQAREIINEARRRGITIPSGLQLRVASLGPAAGG